MGVEDELQAAAEEGNLVIGTEETVKEMERIDRVVIAANAPADIEDAVREAADDADTPVEAVDQDSRQLGSLCMKPFAASVVGIR